MIPFAPVLAGLVDFAIASAILLAMMAYYEIVPTAMIVTLPLFRFSASFDQIYDSRSQPTLP